MFCPLCGIALAYDQGHVCRKKDGLGELPTDYGRFASPAATGVPRGSKIGSGNLGGSDITPWFFFGTSTLATTASAIVVQTDSLPSDCEGLLLGWQYFIESEDYQTSPFTVVTAGVNSSTAPSAVFRAIAAPPSRGNDQLGFTFPYPWGLYFKRDSTVGLFVKNNETATMYTEARIWGVSWPFGQKPAIINSVYR